MALTGGLSRPHLIPQVNSQPQSSQASLVLVQQERTHQGSHPTTESLSGVGVGVGVIGSGLARAWTGHLFIPLTLKLHR